jgi:4-hydroxybenzoate polyprenyltransferase
LLQQDKEDDVKVGVKSTALRFGNDTKYWISGFGLACTSSLALGGYNADLGMFQLMHIMLILYIY